MAHYIWNHSSLPSIYEMHMKMFRDLHPGWRIEFWDDQRIESWMSHFYADPALTDLVRLLEHAYENVVDKRQVSDLLRLGLVWQYGGVYADYDYTFVRNVEPLLEGHACVMTCPSYTNIANGFIAAEAGDVFIKYCLDALTENYFSGRPTVHATGPAFITRMYKSFLKDTGDAGCKLLEKKIAYPYTYNHREKANEEFPDAYMIHRWGSIDGDVWKPES